MQKTASVSSNETSVGSRINSLTPVQSRSPKPHKWRTAFSSLKQRTRSIFYGIVAAAILTLLIAVGSQRFHWFDEALIGYAVATLFAVVAVTYKYSFWLARPPTGRYWRRSWQLFLSYENIRRYALLIPKAIFTNLLSQQFICKRGLYRWIMHQCIFWGVILSCSITFPLTFGWLRFTQNPGGLYQVWAFGFRFFTLPVDSLFGFLLFHALDFTALLLLLGLVLAFYRRFHDLALRAVQRFRFDILPLVLLLAIVVTGLALTADILWLQGAYYPYISLTHEAVVVIWLISLPFGKIFHVLEQPAAVGVELYWRSAEAGTLQQCARCAEEFAPVRFIQDLKKTLYDVGEDYSLSEAPVGVAVSGDGSGGRGVSLPAPWVESRAIVQLWWQDLCPTCKRVMRAQGNLAALGRGGNQFL